MLLLQHAFLQTECSTGHIALAQTADLLGILLHAIGDLRIKQSLVTATAPLVVYTYREVPWNPVHPTHQQGPLLPYVSSCVVLKIDLLFFPSLRSSPSFLSYMYRTT